MSPDWRAQEERVLADLKRLDTNQDKLFAEVDSLRLSVRTLEVKYAIRSVFLGVCGSAVPIVIALAIRFLL
jgi:hypothetical protein